MSVDQALKYVISLGMVMPDDLPVKALPPKNRLKMVIPNITIKVFFFSDGLSFFSN